MIILITGHNWITECSFLQESHTLNTPNTRHNMNIMSLAAFSLASVWLANLIKIRRGEARVGSAVNIGHVSDEQMAWNVVNGVSRSFWKSAYIWFYIWFSVIASVRLIFLKTAVFRHRSVKKGPNDVKPCETFDLIDLFIFREAFLANFGQMFLMISTKFSKNPENWWNILVLIKVLYSTTIIKWI